MATRYNWMMDTSDKAFDKLNELLRGMTPGQKLAQVLEMAAMVVRMSEDFTRQNFPNASEREVFLRAAAARLGRDTVRRVYGWDPESGPAS